MIYNELCKGEIKQTSRDAYLGIISKLADAGAQGIVLGCTEISLLVRQEELSIPLFDTTTLHAQAAVREALSPSRTAAENGCVKSSR